jgi:hypothetical protein
VLVNSFLYIVKLNCYIVKLSEVQGDSEKEEKYQKACCRLQSKKQQQQRLLLVNFVNCFKKEQPVINSKQQLSEKVVDKDIQDILEQSDQITLEHLLLIDTILTLSETSLENKN